MQAGNWTWLEAAKLLVQILTPVTLSVLSIFIHRLSKKYEQTQWRNQKLTEKRLAIYDDIAPDLNNLLCYFTCVGNWKNFTPPEIIATKREIDRKVYLAAPMFSPAFFSSIQAYLNLCFETYTGWGNNAKLRTKYDIRQKVSPDNWNDEWTNCFSENISPAAEIQRAYNETMHAFSHDIGVNSESHKIEHARLPSHVR